MWAAAVQRGLPWRPRPGPAVDRADGAERGERAPGLGRRRGGRALASLVLAAPLLLSSLAVFSGRVPQPPAALWPTAEAVPSSTAGKTPRGPGLRVMSFNLRTEFQEVVDAADGDGWSQRREDVAEVIAKWRPDIVCLQEATASMTAFLVGRLGEDYAWMGTSRTPGKTDEMAAIMYNQRRLLRRDQKCYWYSGQPGVCQRGTTFPRTYESVTFTILPLAGESTGQVIVTNTHWTHEGVEARLQSASILSAHLEQMASKHPGHVQVVTGDFNAPKGSGVGLQAYRRLMRTPGLLDSARHAGTAEYLPNRSTIHRFKGLDFQADHGDGTVDLSDSGGVADGLHLDWVLYRNGQSNDTMRIVPARFVVSYEQRPNGRYPSDHYPLIVDFALRWGD